jgi:hypothetical protein
LWFVLWVKSDSDIYYNKTSDKAATKCVTSDLGYTLGGPHKWLHAAFRFYTSGKWTHGRHLKTESAWKPNINLQVTKTFKRMPKVGGIYNIGVRL